MRLFIRKLVREWGGWRRVILHNRREKILSPLRAHLRIYSNGPAINSSFYFLRILNYSSRSDKVFVSYRKINYSRLKRKPRIFFLCSIKFLTFNHELFSTRCFILAHINFFLQILLKIYNVAETERSLFNISFLSIIFSNKMTCFLDHNSAYLKKFLSFITIK